jgi:hypothetical protein
MKTDNEPRARATMRLPESLWKAVQHRAIDEQLSLSELVELACREYLSRPIRSGSKIIGPRNIESIRRSVERMKAAKKGGRS